MPSLKGWKFPIQVDEDTGKIKTVEDNENIRQSIRLILETQRYERKIFSSFGTNLRSYMFEVVNPTFVTELKKTIASSLKTWEQYIRDLHVSVNASTGPISIVEAGIDYITDLEPTQERVVARIDANDKE